MGRLGWRVHSAPDGLRALQILPEIMPLYAAIADVKMLGPAGTDLLVAIKREQEKAFPECPVRLVLLTGYDIDDDLQARCDEIGARAMVKGEERYSLFNRWLRG